MKISMKRLSVACLLALAPAVALANLIPSGGAPLDLGDGTARWTWNTTLSSDQKIYGGTPPSVNPVANAGVDPSMGGFFTLYDIAGYVGSSCAGPSGWKCEEQPLGFTPAGALPFADLGDVINITFWYDVGGLALSGNSGSGTGLELGAFTLLSTIKDEGGLVSYSSRGVKNNGAAIETYGDNTGQIRGPAVSVPEPTSLALAALGMGAVGVGRRKARKAA